MNITGKVTKNAVVRSTSGDKQVVSFSLAVKAGSYRNAQGEKVVLTDFYDCAYWRSTGIAPYLTKGMMVELSGRVLPKAWQDSQGAIHAGLGFRVSEIILHGEGKANSDKTAQATTGAENTKAISFQKVEDDLPF